MNLIKLKKSGIRFVIISIILIIIVQNFDYFESIKDNYFVLFGIVVSVIIGSFISEYNFFSKKK